MPGNNKYRLGGDKMKKDMSPESLIKEYIEGGTIIMEALLNGDYKANNRAVKKLNKATDSLKNDLDLAK